MNPARKEIPEELKALLRADGRSARGQFISNDSTAEEMVGMLAMAIRDLAQGRNDDAVAKANQVLNNLDQIDAGTRRKTT